MSACALAFGAANVTTKTSTFSAISSNVIPGVVREGITSRIGSIGGTQYRSKASVSIGRRGDHDVWNLRRDDR